MRLFRNAALLAAIVGLAFSNIGRTEAAPTFGPPDLSIPGSSPLTVCKISTELDCIESFGVFDSSQKLIPATYLQDIYYGTFQDPNGNTIINGETVWKVNTPSLNLDATLRVNLESPNHILVVNSNGMNQTGASLRIMVNVPDPKNTKIKLVIRTSWLKPMNVQLKVIDADFKQEKITGGNRFTLIGKGMPFSDYTGDWLNDPSKKSFQAKADMDSYLFQFYVHHAGIDQMHSYFSPICSDVGYSVQAHNTNATGDPTWNAETKSLDFSIWAPHLTAAGELNQGYFQYKVSDKYLDCKFPNNTLTKAKYLEIRILDQDGQRQVATTSVSNANGELSLTASGFHFSTPKIVVTSEDAAPATNVAPTSTPVVTTQPSATPKVVAKNKTITCVKGKLVKKVVAVNPKCPVGYKQK